VRGADTHGLTVEGFGRLCGALDRPFVDARETFRAEKVEPERWPEIKRHFAEVLRRADREGDKATISAFRVAYDRSRTGRPAATRSNRGAQLPSAPVGLAMAPLGEAAVPVIVHAPATQQPVDPDVTLPPIDPKRPALPFRPARAGERAQPPPPTAVDDDPSGATVGLGEESPNATMPFSGAVTALLR